MHPELLAGKRALITGVANEKSLAYAMARRFREAGAVVGLSFGRDRARERQEKLCPGLDCAFIAPCDVREQEQIDDLARAVGRTWENVDILLHSMAFAPRSAFEHDYVHTTWEEFSTAMRVSVFSLTALVRAFLPLFSADASVITLSYLGAQRAIAGYNVMGVAKAALEASVRYLARDLGPNGIRVNAISAGPVRTLAASAIPDFAAGMARVRESAPLPGGITSDDVALTGLYLASSLSRGVTGQTLFVDAGYSII